MTTTSYIYDDAMDVLLDKPLETEINGRRMAFHHACIGTSLIVSRLCRIMRLNLTDGDGLAARILSSVMNHREEALLVIVHYSMTRREEHFNAALLRERVGFLRTNLKDRDIASLLLRLLTMDDLTAYMNGTGMSEDARRRGTIAKIKGGKGAVSIGGRTIFGNTISAACEKYGWAYNECVWEVPFAALQMMLADSMTSSYLTEKEMRRFKSCGASAVAGGNGKMSFAEFKDALRAFKR